MTIDVLWQNPNITQNFNSLTLPYSSAYKFIEIIINTRTDVYTGGLVHFKADATITNATITIAGTSATRQFSVNNYKLNYQADTQNPEYLIPVMILGYK